MQFLDLPVWESALRGLMAFLCRVIYPIIGFMYELFSNVSKINILSGAVEPIYQRVTLILTIVMVFYITFQFVKYVVQPDGLTDKEKGAGNIVYKAIIVVVLIAFVPKIFEMAYTVQSKIIDTNVISKVVLGPQASTDDNNLGSGFSATIFNMFYYVDEENASKDCHDGLDCATLVDNNVYNLSTENSLSSLSVGLNATDKKGETPLITFDGLLAVIFGGFVLYILMLYCIDVGVRWVQLIYLQVIAPIPIIGYLSPKKDGIFQKWTKQCFTTYLDLFLRVAIINIVLLLCDTILRAKSNLDQTGGLLAGLGEVSGMMETLIYIVLIMGVMLFAHKAPKMLAELFPKAGAASGNFGIGLKDAKERITPTTDVLRTGRRVVGGAAGGIAGAVIGARTGRALSGMIKGGKAGAEKKGNLFGNVRQSMHSVSSDVQKDLDVKAKGGSIYGSRFLSGHYQNVAKKQDRKIDEYKSVKTGKDQIFSQVDEFKEIKTLKKSWEAAKAAGRTQEARNLEAQYKSMGQAIRESIVANKGKIPIGPVQYTYYDIAADGSKIPGTGKTATYRFDSGDAIFADTLNHLAEEERRKIKGTAIEDLMIEINGQMKRVGDLDAKEYAANLHTIADLAAAEEIKAKDEAYTKAHANAQGTNSGK